MLAALKENIERTVGRKVPDDNCSIFLPTYLKKLLTKKKYLLKQDMFVNIFTLSRKALVTHTSMTRKEKHMPFNLVLMGIGFPTCIAFSRDARASIP